MAETLPPHLGPDLPPERVECVPGALPCDTASCLHEQLRSQSASWPRAYKILIISEHCVPEAVMETDLGKCISEPVLVSVTFDCGKTI